MHKTTSGKMSPTSSQKTKTCKQCHQPFVPRRPLQSVCGLECAINQSRDKRLKLAQKQRRRQLKADRERLATPRELGSKAQQAFNAYIRMRDCHKPCVSCGQSPYQGQRHASHFRSRAAASQLRYHPSNVHASCAQCNSFKSGNIVPYRAELVRRIGADKVEWLECNQEKRTFTTTEYRRIAQVYRRKLKLYKTFREGREQ